MRTALLFALSAGLACASPAQPPIANSDAGQPAPPYDAGMTRTWYRDMMPIVQVHCLSCHREGGVGPFRLDDPQLGSAMAGAIAAVVAEGTMPPWMPNSDGLALLGDRRLSDAEKAVVAQWAAQGGVVGDPADAPTEPPPPVDHLDDADIEVAPARPYLPVRLGERDDYHCSVVDLGLSEERDFVAYEVLPGATGLVHHVILFAGPLGRALEQEDTPGSGYTCYGGPGARGFRNIGGWVPGTTVTRLPAGTGQLLQPGEGLILQIHYNTAVLEPVEDRTRLRFKWAEAPVTHHLQLVPQAARPLNIPAGARGHVESDLWEVPIRASVFSTLPHMHAQGTAIRLDRIRDGEQQTIIHIPRWDFNWQQAYFFAAAEGIELRAGDQLRLTCTYDNNTDSEVNWGESTTDEMCLNYLLVSLDGDGDPGIEPATCQEAVRCIYERCGLRDTVCHRACGEALGGADQRALLAVYQCGVRNRCLNREQLADDCAEQLASCVG